MIMAGKKQKPTPKLFNRWDLKEVEVKDDGLKRYLNLEPLIVPRTGGRHTQITHEKKKMNIVERFMNKLMVPGHRGKKHKLSSARCTGKTSLLYNAVKDAFEIIEKKTKKNPVQILVEAIENSALLEEIAAYRLGGIIARKAVITSPQRRLDLALRHLAQGIYNKSFKGDKPLEKVIAQELILASKGEKEAFAVQQRMRKEKEAEGAR